MNTGKEAPHHPLFEHEERTRAIMDCALDAIIMIDDQGKISFWNAAAERILGFGSDEALGRNLHELIAPARFLPAHQAAFPEFRRSGHGDGMGKIHELSARRKDGQEIEVSLSLSSMRFSNRWHAVGIVQDITERKRIEAKNKELVALVDSTDDAIVVMQPDRKIRVWNKGAERLYGYSAGEMIGASIAVLIPPEHADEEERIHEKILRGETVAHHEATQLRNGGARITVSVSLSAIRDMNGRIVAIASTARDITARKAMEAQLSRVQRLESLATLAGGVAHQFNNINTIIKGYVELIGSEKGLSAKSSSYVQEALAGVQKAVDITARLMMLTQQGGPLKRVRLDLLARDLLRAYGARLDAARAVLVLELADTPPAEANEALLRSVLSSLIDNALDSLSGRSVRTLAVRTGSEEGGSYFEVQDSGCGISEGDLPKLFVPFYSAKGEWAPPGSAQTTMKGVGLSLAVCSVAVSEYGGRIDVRSTEGIGSTFRVVLPASSLAT